MLVLVVMIVVVCVIMRVCYFGLLFGSFVILCHLSRGQSFAFHGASVCAASSARSGALRAVYASLLLYESGLCRVKPSARVEGKDLQPYLPLDGLSGLQNDHACVLLPGPLGAKGVVVVELRLN